MKKSILFFGLVAGTFAANAQVTPTPVTPATNVTLNVNLHPLQSIVVNPSKNVVNLDYVTAGHYQGGVSKEEVDHLNVFSTQGFQVQVKSLNNSLTSTDTDKSIDLEDIRITSSKGTATNGINSPIGTYTPSAVELSTTAATIGASDSAGGGNINVTYSAAGNNKYLSKVDGTGVRTYTANIQYSIIAN